MIRKLTYLSMLCLLVSASAAAQGTFKPRNADEAHAWRLYEQYKASNKKEAQLRVAIQQTSGDIKTVNVGSVPGLGIDPKDVARLGQLRQQLLAETERQMNLEKAWDKKFSGRYGYLKESEETIYDPTTKKNMDKIQFRLISFPFYVNDGTYTGTITGAPGTISLTISGTSVKGTVKGVYKYTFLDETYSDPFAGSVSGSLANNTAIKATLSGSVGGSPFTGSLTGTISKGVITGSWTTKALTTASGRFTARRK